MRVQSPERGKSLPSGCSWGASVPGVEQDGVFEYFYLVGWGRHPPPSSLLPVLGLLFQQGHRLARLPAGTFHLGEQPLGVLEELEELV